MTLIRTKLSSPHAAPGLMARHRLVSRFDLEERACHLACVVAPAGYGKSTLLCQWREKLDSAGIPSGWVSLDEDDNDPARYLSYIASALDAVLPGLGGKVTAQLQTGVLPPLKPVLESIVNDLASVSGPFALFLDDYHRVTDPAALQMTDWLVTHAPANMCLVVASRSKPSLPINKLMVQGELLYLSAEDLSLEPDEARRFVNELRGLDLNDAEIGALSERTEGWFAGLQLVAMTIKNLPDRKKFIDEFSGTDEDITSYLGEVVLSQQTKDMRRFLLITSVLDRFCAEVCEEITGQETSQAVLERAYADNLFLVPLDRHHKWYRYHHLFGDFLSARFKQESPDLVAQTYGTASIWFAARDLIPEAIQYAFAAGDFARAAELISGIAPTLVKYRGEHATLLNWLQALPRENLDDWPENRLCWAWSLTLLRDFDEAERILRWLDRYCERVKDDAAPEAITERDYVMRKAHVTRCVKLGMIDDSHGARRACIDWLERWPDAGPYDMGVANNVLGIACINTFEFDRGLAALERAAQSFGRCKADYGLAWAGALAGIIMMAQGHIENAHKVLNRALDEASQVLGPNSYSISLLSLILADLLYERGDLDAAEQALEKGFPSALDHGILETALAGCATRAKLLFAKGDLDAAIGTLEQGERVGGERFSERLPLALRGEQTALLIRAGRLEEAVGLAERFSFFGPPKDVAGVDARESSREIPKVAAARIWIASGQSRRALPVLTTLITRAKSVGRTRKVIELLALKSKAAWLQGDERQAMRAFSEALKLGEPEGFYRVFIDEGPDVVGDIVARMIELRSAGGQENGVGTSPGYLQRIAEGLGIIVSNALHMDRDEQGGNVDVSLTKRELDVLSHIGGGLSNKELANSLFISEQTVKWHLYNVYGKLGVRNRTAAVATARRMSLID